MSSAHCIALSLAAAASLAATAACLAADTPAYFMFEQKSPKGETEQFTFKLTDPARIAEARKILADKTDMRRSVEGTIIQHKAAYNASAKTGELEFGEAIAATGKALPSFPSDPYEQPLAIEAILSASGGAMNAAELARSFKRGGKRIEQRVSQVLTTLARYGRVSVLKGGRYAARRAA